MDPSRSVLIRYTRDGKSRRGSGLRVGGRFVLTADHCANGTNHRLVVGGHAYPATVHVRNPKIDRFPQQRRPHPFTPIERLRRSQYPPAAVGPDRCARANPDGQRLLMQVDGPGNLADPAVAVAMKGQSTSRS